MNTFTNLRSLCFILMITLSITSCKDTDVAPTDLYGKWEFLRVEETLSNVFPPKEDSNIWIEFRESSSLNSTSPPALPYSFNGAALVNFYFGGFEVDGKLLSIKGVGSTRRGGEVAHMIFDDYYFNKLSKAESYYLHENNQTLVITTNEKHKLIFRRITNNE